jgi:hypothetical protein
MFNKSENPRVFDPANHGNWVPDLTATRKRLEGIIASPQTRYLNLVLIH